MSAIYVLVAVGSASIVVVVAGRLRPGIRARASASQAPSRWWLGVGIAGLAAIANGFLGMVVLMTPAVWRHGSAVRTGRLTARRISSDFPHALDMLVLSIRAGYLPAQAIGEIVPYLSTTLRPSFIAVREAMREGQRFADALLQLPRQLGPLAQPLVDSLSAADRYGLPLAPVLERLSFEARQQRRRDTDAAARELPVRLAMPLVLCTLPSFVLLAIVPLLLGALSSLHT